MRPRNSLRTPVRSLLAVAVLLAGPASGAPGTARFPAVPLAGGGRAAAHASVSGDPSDEAAAGRRAHIARSPYLHVSEERVLRGGDVRLGFEKDVSPEVRDAVVGGLSAFFASFFDHEGFARVGTARAPLVLLVTAQRDVPATAGWDGRDDGALVRPLAAVPAGGRDAATVVLDLAHQVALLSLRETSADAPAWAVEGTAEYLARRELALGGPPAVEADPLLAESGALTDPAVLPEFLAALVKRLPRGLADLKSAWEEMGTRRGDEAETMLRTLASRADARGVPGILGDLLVRRLSRTSPEEPLPGGRRALPAGGFAAPAPPPLGWRRISLRTSDETGGVEIVLPDPARCATGRALIAYRGEGDGFDAVDLAPGAPHRIPLSGTARLGLLLVDGAEPGDLFVELRRLPDYPAALSASAAEWTGDGARLSWRTASHRDLLAWVVSRVDQSEGEAREPERRIVPTSESDDGGFAYQLDDPTAVPGHRYLYRVYALTTDGMLSEAFDASVVAGR